MLNHSTWRGLRVGSRWIAGIFFASLFAAAGETAPAPAKESKGGLPPYISTFKNGFYATIAGFNNSGIASKSVCIPNLNYERLNVDGFSCSVPVQTVVQPGAAPLVVVLLGAEGKALDPLTRQWVLWLSEGGCHVLTFNSTLQADFVSVCGRGVSGNLQNEAECVRDVVGAYLKSPGMQGKVTQIGIVGMSYGGVEALLLGKMAAENKLPFKIDAIQAYSPPIDIMRSMELIDRWWREDRWKYTLTEIYLKVARHKPIAGGDDIPLSDSLMRAGVAASFRLDLADVVDKNDATYHLHILPAANDTYEERLRRHDYAETWGFTRFFQRCSYPYWREKLKLNDLSEFNQDAKLCNLLPKAPDYAEVFIADDDPLNAAEDLDALKKCAGSARLTILQGGGHAGYCNDAWTKDRLGELFKK